MRALKCVTAAIAVAVCVVSASAGVARAAATELSVSMSADPMAPGSVGAFTLTVAVDPAGGAETTPVTVTATLTAGVTVASASSGGGWDCSATVDGSAEVSCTHGLSAASPLAPGHALPPIAVAVAVPFGVPVGEVAVSVTAADAGAPGDGSGQRGDPDRPVAAPDPSGVHPAGLCRPRRCGDVRLHGHQHGARSGHRPSGGGIAVRSRVVSGVVTGTRGLDGVQPRSTPPTSTISTPERSPRPPRRTRSARWACRCCHRRRVRSHRGAGSRRSGFGCWSPPVGSPRSALGLASPSW